MSHPDIVPRDSIADDDVDADTAASLLSFAPSSLQPSAAPTLHRHSYEHGRRYHAFRNGKYPLPNDDREQAREDMKHALVMELTGGRLVHAPIGNSPQRIIDLGTGTGIWAIEVGDKYPSAEVVGVDLSPIQPVWVPPNVKFIVDDIEDEWITTSGKYDYAHVRQVMQFIAKKAQVLSRCYENLKPGGWIESCDFGAEALCDDDTMPDDWPVKLFYERLGEALCRTGGGRHESISSNDDGSNEVVDGRCDVRVASRFGTFLERAGFVNVSVRVYALPIGTWPADKNLRLVGMYMRQVLEDFLDAAARKPFAALDMTGDETAAFMAKVRDALQTRSVHCYEKFYVWTGQKPLDAEADGTQ